MRDQRQKLFVLLILNISISIWNFHQKFLFNSICCPFAIDLRSQSVLRRLLLLQSDGDNDSKCGQKKLVQTWKLSFYRKKVQCTVSSHSIPNESDILLIAITDWFWTKIHFQWTNWSYSLGPHTATDRKNDSDWNGIDSVYSIYHCSVSVHYHCSKSWNFKIHRIRMRIQPIFWWMDRRTLTMRWAFALWIWR